MSYHIKYDDMWTIRNATGQIIGAWFESFQNIQAALDDLCSSQDFQGQAAEGVRAYISEVHYSFLAILSEICMAYQNKFILYKDGYTAIDDGLSTEIKDEVLTGVHDEVQQLRLKVESNAEAVAQILKEVYDVMDEPAVYPEALCTSHEKIERHTRQLYEDVGSYESEHLQNDFCEVDELIHQLKTALQEVLSYTRSDIAQYQVGNIQRLKNFRALNLAYHDAYTYRQENAEAIERAYVSENARIEQLEEELARQRAEQGFWDAIAAIGAIVVGAVAIVCTAGAATPIVVTACVAGGSSILYGASNFIEAEQDIYYGLQGDPYTSAWNPIRDTVFMGNQKAYDLWGSASVTVAGLIVPANKVLQATTQTLGKGGTALAATRAAAAEIGKFAVPEIVESTVSAVDPKLGFAAGMVTDFLVDGDIDRVHTIDTVDTARRMGKISDQQEQVNDLIKRVERGDLLLRNNLQKGNYGEMKMDIYFENQGYKRISFNRVTDLDTPTHHGIDGVYYNPNGHPPYVIGEAKYGSSQLNMTRDGKQMSDSWINGSDRLTNAVGKDIADDILLEGYSKQVINISPNGDIKTTALSE